MRCYKNRFSRSWKQRKRQNSLLPHTKCIIILTTAAVIIILNKNNCIVIQSCEETTWRPLKQISAFHLAGDARSMAKCGRKACWERGARTPSSPAPVGDFARSPAPRIKNTHINYPFPNQPRPRPICGLMNSMRRNKGDLLLKRGEGCGGGGGGEVGGGGGLSGGMRPACVVMTVWQLGRDIFHKI